MTQLYAIEYIDRFVQHEKYELRYFRKDKYGGEEEVYLKDLDFSKELKITVHDAGKELNSLHCLEFVKDEYKNDCFVSVITNQMRAFGHPLLKGETRYNVRVNYKTR